MAHDPSQPDVPAAPEGGSGTRERLLAKARDLPRAPGVYLMKDGAGVVLYVGKAVSLPDRVGSYFLPSTDLGPASSPC